MKVRRRAHSRSSEENEPRSIFELNLIPIAPVALPFRDSRAR